MRPMPSRVAARRRHREPFDDDELPLVPDAVGARVGVCGILVVLALAVGAHLLTTSGVLGGPSPLDAAAGWAATE